MNNDGPWPWQCAINAPSPNVVDWCFLEEGHKGVHSFQRPPHVEDIVKYKVYTHSNKESCYEAARDGGITEEELQGRFQELVYVGMELMIDVEVNRTTGKITTKMSGE